MSAPVIVIYNPSCGDRTAQACIENQVLPLLSHHQIQPVNVIATTHPGHAASVVIQLLETTEGPVSIILGSGDGTLHEIVDALDKHQPANPRDPVKISFALVPCGTANALYSSLFPPSAVDADAMKYKLKSVQALIDNGSTVPLTLALTSLFRAPPSRAPPRTAVSAVVASTALHAVILRDSENLRAESPGVDRFKQAAMANITRWYNASVRLLPTRNRCVQVWDPALAKFVPAGSDEGEGGESEDDDDIVDLIGPFAYFLSTVNVDRLEPAFRIAPLAREVRPQRATMDVIIVRPLRDPSLKDEGEQSRRAFSEKVTQVLGAAYREGAHINMRYGQDGAVTESGEGATVVEYYRCAGWEWEPLDDDDAAHLVCADGDILQIEPGGKATCSASTPGDNKGFTVYV